MDDAHRSEIAVVSTGFSLWHLQAAIRLAPVLQERFQQSNEFVTSLPDAQPFGLLCGLFSAPRQAVVSSDFACRIFGTLFQGVFVLLQTRELDLGLLGV